VGLKAGREERGGGKKEQEEEEEEAPLPCPVATRLFVSVAWVAFWVDS